MDSVGVLTPSFTAPAYCNTPLVSCSTLGYRFVDCTPVYGQTCGPNGTPTLAADCFPNGKKYTSRLLAPTYSPGEQCPSQYKPESTTIYTTTDYVTNPGGIGYSPTYYKATQVQCCPTDYTYSQAVPCQSTYAGGPTVAYFCDFDTTITSSVTLPPYVEGQYTYATLTRADNTMPTRLYNYARAFGIKYVSGSVGTGPWTTASSSTRYSGGGYVGGGGSSGGSSSSESSLEASRRRSRTTKIAIGVAVPVAIAIFAALLLCCRQRSKAKKAAEPAGPGTHAQPMVLQGPAPVPVAPVGPNVQSYQTTSPSPLTNFFNAPGNPPPGYTDKQEAIVGVNDHTARLAQLEADKARIDEELARMRQTALEEEQARVQAEIQNLRNQHSA